MKEVEDSDQPGEKAATQALSSQSAPWRAKSVWIAASLILIGAIFWARDAARTPARPSSTSAPGVSGFAEPAPGVGTGGGQVVCAPRAWPATCRLGVSYLGGFFLGWALRRFLKATLLLSGAAIALIALGKKLGWLDLDWASVENHVRTSLAWIQGEAGSIKQFLTGYLPSAGAAGLGVFFGFRRK